MKYFIIPADLARQIATPTLQPRLLADGAFTLNVDVLYDPEHAAACDVLSGLPQVEREVLEFPPEPQEDA